MYALGRLIPLAADADWGPFPSAWPLFSNAHSFIWKVRCQISVVCVTPSPGSPMTTEEIIIMWPWLAGAFAKRPDFLLWDCYSR